MPAIVNPSTKPPVHRNLALLWIAILLVAFSMLAGGIVKGQEPTVVFMPTVSPKPSDAFMPTSKQSVQTLPTNTIAPVCTNGVCTLPATSPTPAATTTMIWQYVYYRLGNTLSARWELAPASGSITSSPLAGCANGSCSR
jgi:hypothetical protein